MKEPIPEKTVRDAKGRWVKGTRPVGAHQFKLGEAANPKGRPKGRYLSQELKAYMNKKIEDVPHLLELAKKKKIKIDDGMLAQDVFVMLCVENALKGNAPYMKEIWERIEGKVKEQCEISIKDEVKEDFDVIGEFLKTRKGKHGNQ